LHTNISDSDNTKLQIGAVTAKLARLNFQLLS